MLKSVIFIALFGLALAQKQTFENYKVFRILPTNYEQTELLHQLADGSNGVSINFPSIFISFYLDKVDSIKPLNQ